MLVELVHRADPRTGMPWLVLCWRGMETLKMTLLSTRSLQSLENTDRSGFEHTDRSGFENAD
eukprot:COSAG04_NODE_28956_length_272_cov_0.601156_1_plen_61_part_10